MARLRPIRAGRGRVASVSAATSLQWTLHEEGGKIAWEGRVMVNAAITPDLLERGLARFREPLGANLMSTLVDRAADRLVSVRDSQGGTSSPPVYVGRG